MKIISKMGAPCQLRRNSINPGAQPDSTAPKDGGGTTPPWRWTGGLKYRRKEGPVGATSQGLGEGAPTNLEQTLGLYRMRTNKGK